MKRLVVVALCACTVVPAALPVVPPHEIDRIRRIASILDYVAADYAGAVVAGVIKSDVEYKEQLGFVHDAGELARLLEPSDAALETGLSEVRTLVERRADAEVVGKQCRALRTAILERHGVVLSPSVPPSHARGAELYSQNCVRCHGAEGDGKGPEAARLAPPPRSFLDPEVVKDLSPARVYNALTDGVRGTAMASFGLLPSADRWSLSFYVLGLRHDSAAALLGEKLYGQSGRSVGLTRLAGASDQELLDAFQDKNSDVLAFLRVRAPYRTAGAPFDQARQLLVAAGRAMHGVDRASVRASLDSAYLDGVEPHEGALRARDAELVLHIEEHFFRLRQQTDADAFEREMLQLSALLDRADETLVGGGDRVAFVGALLVILREGIEASLLLLLLLGLARRAGAEVRAVHAGWVSAVVAGAGTWFASGPLLALGGARRELIEGVVSLLAAAALLFAGHYVIARLDAKRRVELLRQRFAAASTAKRFWVLWSLGFVAIYREAFEIVLFLRALSLDTHDSSFGMWMGALAGAVGCIVLVVLLRTVGRFLKPAALLSASGTLLCGLAVVLVGKGVRALQESGALGIRPLALPRIEWLGLFPSLQGVAAQIVVLAAF